MKKKNKQTEHINDQPLHTKKEKKNPQRSEQIAISETSFGVSH